MKHIDRDHINFEYLVASLRQGIPFGLIGDTHGISVRTSGRRMIKLKSWPAVRDHLKLELYKRQPEGSGAVQPEDVKDLSCDGAKDTTLESEGARSTCEPMLKMFFENEEKAGNLKAFLDRTNLSMPVMMQQRFVILIQQLMQTFLGRVFRFMGFRILQSS